MTVGPGTATILRIVTCGSVDDGKSTLIGRLLYDARLLPEDQLDLLTHDSKGNGSENEMDFALLVDGLEAEREQGITIDVAYRYFATPKRTFIVADAPGHEQYTCNMATGASTADLAVLLVDARKGVLEQTRRHARIVSLLGIRHVILAVNKMDLVGFREEVFAEIADAFDVVARELDFADVQAIPISARHGDNLTARSANMPWHDGPALLDHLEHVEIVSRPADGPPRFPVQWVNRCDPDFRGYAGTIAGGAIARGDNVVVVSSGKLASVSRIVTRDGDLQRAESGDAVTLVLDRELDISRGDMLARPEQRPDFTDQFAAHVIWMNNEELVPARSYALKIGRQTITATVTEIKHRIDVNTGQHLAAKSLQLNEIGMCNLSLAEPVAFDAYKDNRTTGSFILIDRFTNDTVAAGMIDFPLRRALNIHWQDIAIDQSAHAAQKHQKPVMLWFTGLSGAGKSTIANLVEQRLFVLGKHTYTLDGDNVRHGLCRDLGFTDVDRAENIRRAAEVGKLMVNAGLIVLVSFISPFRAERQLARELLGKESFVEIYVSATLEVAEERDPKGLYAKARAGELSNFTGIDSPYEPPESPDLVLDTVNETADALARKVIDFLTARGTLPPFDRE